MPNDCPLTEIHHPQYETGWPMPVASAARPGSRTPHGGSDLQNHHFVHHLSSCRPLQTPTSGAQSPTHPAPSGVLGHLVGSCATQHDLSQDPTTCPRSPQTTPRRPPGPGTRPPSPQPPRDRPPSPEKTGLGRAGRPLVGPSAAGALQTASRRTTGHRSKNRHSASTSTGIGATTTHWGETPPRELLAYRRTGSGCRTQRLAVHPTPGTMASNPLRPVARYAPLREDAP